MKQLIGIACSLLMLLLIVACNPRDEIVSLNPLAPGEALGPAGASGEISAGGGGQEGVVGKPVSTNDVFPPAEEINDKPREVPIGVPGDINQLKKQPPAPSEGPAEEDKAKKD